MFSSVPNIVRSDVTSNDDRNSFELDFWQNFEDDLMKSSIPFDATDTGLWNGRFVPPPPRPPFLDETVISDGLTTCDLCSWASVNKNAYSLEGSLEATGELGWAFTIAIVSVISALIGAIIMITLLRCKRLKSTNRTNSQLIPWLCRKNDISSSNSGTPKQRPVENLPAPHANPQVWIWLKNVNTPQNVEPIPFPPSASVENYYTNTDDNISSPSKVSEVVYEEISGIG